MTSRFSMLEARIVLVASVIVPRSAGSVSLTTRVSGRLRRPARIEALIRTSCAPKRLSTKSRPIIRPRARPRGWRRDWCASAAAAAARGPPRAAEVDPPLGPAAWCPRAVFWSRRQLPTCPGRRTADRQRAGEPSPAQPAGPGSPGAAEAVRCAASRLCAQSFLSVAPEVAPAFAVVSWCPLMLLEVLADLVLLDRPSVEP